MADDQTQLDFTAAVRRLEEINAWFQENDFNLDEGLAKLKEGKALIKTCRERLKAVENEFVQTKADFGETSPDQTADFKPVSTQREELARTPGRDADFPADEVDF